jgi:hypothetical protein
MPYFGNQGVIMSPFPHKQKRTVLRAYPELTGIPFGETVPDLGLFSFQYRPIFVSAKPSSRYELFQATHR